MAYGVATMCLLCTVEADIRWRENVMMMMLACLVVVVRCNGSYGRETFV